MHRINSLLSVLVVALLTLTFAPSWTLAVPSRSHGRPTTPLHLDLPRDPSDDDKRGWIRRIRDSLIQKAFRISQREHCLTVGKQHAKSASQKLSSSGPPANLLARYGEDIVLRFNISSNTEAKVLAEATNTLFLDIWESNNQWVDIRLSKDVVPSLLGLLPLSLQHSHTPLMHDLAQTIYESYPSAPNKDQTARESQAFTPTLRTSSVATENLFFSNYQPNSVIVPWMKLLASLFPTHVKTFSIGLTFEGRDIQALRIGVHPTNSQTKITPRKTILISGGSHAREWISVSTVNYIAYSFITSYGKSSMVTKLLEEFDWVFIPTLNVDGYVYTWENDRLWRKNRQETSLRFCRGIDLDRSWGFHWDEEFAKGNPCSESFPGESAFQAVESHRLAEWAKNETENNNTEFIGFIDFHSYSQQILYPYSYTCGHSPPSLENLEELAMGLAKSIRMTTGEQYGVASACEDTSHFQHDKKVVHPRMETGGGSALDWFYHEIGVQFAYQIKLRDTGSYGFLLPKENIVPTGDEAVNAMIYLGKFLRGESVLANEDDLANLGNEEPGHHQEAERLVDLEFRVVQKNNEEKDEAEEDDTDGMSWELRRRRRR